LMLFHWYYFFRWYCHCHWLFSCWPLMPPLLPLLIAADWYFIDIRHISLYWLILLLFD
jgi:hypothetical protein